MNISAAAQVSGLTTKALRYYESSGLVVPGRCANGYRDYSDADLEALHFIRRARNAGFSVDEVSDLLALHRNPRRRSREARAMVEGKLGQLERQIEQLRDMRATLRELARDCPGDDSPECSILAGLAAPGAR
ncbi:MULTISPECIES: MerR family DNA-binding protein [Microbulbifer]|uniref:MerR family DNA-binding protein n=1 Tax=Microbulbifer TaxID=48073 RepID=UPI001E53F630|nr:MULTISPECIES: MerR family transcriptional regulator [Microbulbifer]UHQ55139.1 MerR family DNA-binding protein [Microbulbifer sp. YPW16]